MSRRLPVELVNRILSEVNRLRREDAALVLQSIYRMRRGWNSQLNRRLNQMRFARRARGYTISNVSAAAAARRRNLYNRIYNN